MKTLFYIVCGIMIGMGIIMYAIGCLLPDMGPIGSIPAQEQIDVEYEPANEDITCYELQYQTSTTAYGWSPGKVASSRVQVDSNTALLVVPCPDIQAMTIALSQYR